MRQGIIRIQRDRLLIANDCACKTIFCKRVPIETSTQISFVRLRIVRATFCQAQTFINRQVRHDCFGNVRRDRVFQVENIRKLLVELSRPRRGFVSYIKELNGDANAFRRSSDAPVQHECDAQFASCSQRVSVRSITEYAAGWSYCEVANST